MDFKTLLCSECKKDVPVDKIRYQSTKDGERKLVCNACMGEGELREPTSSSLNPAPLEQPKKVLYKCRRCKYDFRHGERSASKLVCPYCGKDDEIVEPGF